MKPTATEFTEVCPLCGASWQGEPIPQRAIDEGWYAPGATRYGRQMGIYDMYKDMTVAYECPDCKGQVPREGL